jgi:hypothetical protein
MYHAGIHGTWEADGTHQTSTTSALTGKHYLTLLSVAQTA